METAPVVQTRVQASSTSRCSRRDARTVLLYENLAAAVHAFDLIPRLGTGRPAEVELFNHGSQVWKFDELVHPEHRESAKAAAIEADLIIISARVDVELPTPIKRWIESWLPQKNGRPTALVALLNGAAKPVERNRARQPVRDYLRRAARFAQMDFLCETGHHYGRWWRKFAVVIGKLGRHRSKIPTPAGVPFQPGLGGRCLHAIA